ncbi:hypothetical protein EI77_02026 [Prosthecobacter fusiformis]|uniref:Uncharacterized protein n=1 Tax=Prosthecobacter fusiformis TaxID=48464 RepID=A0A4R7S0K5_9BACT|nr:hypothetical protein [Prosthecobacter fusiformis]TDU70908.1 hypothetical protein EI77_02026 [Prosthecobacter fusiformis]
MRRFSRHLPSHPPAQPLGWRVKVVLAGLAALLMAWLYSQPQALFFIGGMTGLFYLASIRERRRIQSLKSSRADTICAFRKAFDCRVVDPWIIRATYQEVQNWSRGFPLEATDNLMEQLKMEAEDLDDLAEDIAKRSGYDLADISGNPWYQRVTTARELVLFINHQPKIRPA